jgi:hypothetical protein
MGFRPALAVGTDQYSVQGYCSGAEPRECGTGRDRRAAGSLESRELTGIGQSSAEVLEIPAGVLAPRLTGHLLDQIVARGARGGPLFPLAAQLNADLARLQGQQTQDVLRKLGADILDAIGRISQPPLAAVPVALSQLPPLAPGFTGRDEDIAQRSAVKDLLWRAAADSRSR